jgi:hypothetical protein
LKSGTAAVEDELETTALLRITVVIGAGSNALCVMAGAAWVAAARAGADAVPCCAAVALSFGRQISATGGRAWRR